MDRRRCRNRDCQAILPPSPKAHHSLMYCSAECKRIGAHSLSDAVRTDEPIEYINDFGQSSYAFYCRIGLRLTGNWRYFPVRPLPLPLAQLPPLPRGGPTRVQFFDEGLILLRECELRIFLPEELIPKFCRFTDGCRTRTTWEK